MENGSENTIELIPGGKKIQITESNKGEYLELRVGWMCYNSVKQQLEALATGFFSVIPKGAVIDFSAEELEQIICGSSIIDLADWHRHTTYNLPYSETHKVIVWFWKALSEYTQPELSNFVKFCTGTGRIPIQGFAALESNRGELAKFAIHSTSFNAKANSYPKAHTCFNRLLLPLYPSFESLKKGMDFVVKNEVTGFGID